MNVLKSLFIKPSAAPSPYQKIKETCLNCDGAGIMQRLCGEEEDCWDCEGRGFTWRGVSD